MAKEILEKLKWFHGDEFKEEILEEEFLEYLKIEENEHRGNNKNN